MLDKEFSKDSDTKCWTLCSSTSEPLPKATETDHNPVPQDAVVVYSIRNTAIFIRHTFILIP